MAKLIYSAIASLDGYIEDEGGKFDWAEPDEEVHAFINNAERKVATYLYGRRMYETMAGWETNASLAAQSPIMRDFAEIWQAADKVVYSTTLDAASTARTTIERAFDPDAVRDLKARARGDLSLGGPGLAADAFRAGLVDECHLYLAPIAVGGGKRVLPRGIRIPLTLVEERRFSSGMVYLRYLVADAGASGSDVR
jgi:dihydrofolate reductase